MPDEVKLRPTPPQLLPPDEAFRPGGRVGQGAYPPDDPFWQTIIFESNDYKISHYRASAQQLANDLGYAVLLHYYALPRFHNTNSTMLAAFIPSRMSATPAARSKKSD